MLKLFVENEVADNPTMKLRWCVDTETFNWLRDNKISHPQLLIVTRNQQSGREDRYLTGLRDIMYFVPFHGPGKNDVFATIVWDSEDKSAEDVFLRRDNGYYKNHVINSKGEMFADLDNTRDRAQKMVRVDKKLFPERPRDWDWVNLWFSSKPVDECACRRRRMLAYTVQPIAMALLYFVVSLIFSVAAIGSVLGMACIGRLPSDWSSLNPFEFGDFNPKDAYDWSYSRPKKSFFTKWYSFPLRPIFVLVFAAIAIIAGIKGNATYFWDVVLVGAEVFACLFVLYLLVGVIFVKPIASKRKALEAWLNKATAAYEKYQQAREQRSRDREYKRMLVLACTTVDKADPMVIPKEAHTARLAFSGVKRKVCRPYAS